MQYTLITFLVCLITGFAISTYVRNMDWISEKTLWEDALEKNPDSYRAHHNLAWGYYDKIKDYRTSFSLYEKSLTKNKNKITDGITALNNMATIYYLQMEFEKAAELWKRAHEIYPAYELAKYRESLAIAMMGDYETSLKRVDEMLKINPKSGPVNKLKGKLLIKKGQSQEAMVYAMKAYKTYPNEISYKQFMGVANNNIGNYDEAQSYFEKIHSQKPKNKLIILWLIDTAIKQEQKHKANDYIEKLFALVPPGKVVPVLQEQKNIELLTPLSNPLFIKMIADKFASKAASLNNTKSTYKES